MNADLLWTTVKLPSLQWIVGDVKTPFPKALHHIICFSSGSSRPQSLFFPWWCWETTALFTQWIEEHISLSCCSPGSQNTDKAKPVFSWERMFYLWQWREQKVTQHLGADIFVTMTNAGVKPFKGKRICFSSQCEKFPAMAAGSTVSRPVLGIMA